MGLWGNILEATIFGSSSSMKDSVTKPFSGVRDDLIRGTMKFDALRIANEEYGAKHGGAVASYDVLADFVKWHEDWELRHGSAPSSQDHKISVVTGSAPFVTSFGKYEAIYGSYASVRDKVDAYMDSVSGGLPSAADPSGMMKRMYDLAAKSVDEVSYGFVSIEKDSESGSHVSSMRSCGLWDSSFRAIDGYLDAHPDAIISGLGCDATPEFLSSIKERISAANVALLKETVRSAVDSAECLSRLAASGLGAMVGDGGEKSKDRGCQADETLCFSSGEADAGEVSFGK